MNITPDRQNYKYRYIMQKDKNSPLAIIYPSIGEGITSHHSVVLAKMFYDAGYSVLIQGSHFQWEFVKSMPANYRPGLPKQDARDLQKITGKIIDSLEAKYDCKFHDNVLIGTSFGALMTLYIANEEAQKNTLNISKFISINPPIELVYAMKQIDKNTQEWNKNPENIKEKVAITAAKIMQVYNNKETLDKTNITLPFSEYEGKLITGFLMHQKLSDLIYTLEGNSKDIYSKIYNMGYEDYAAFVLEENMAKNEKNVYDLLDKIWPSALAKAKEELADINAEIKKEGGNYEAEGWDWRYYFEKAKKAKYNLDENEMRPYFELGHVREGIFYVANKLYGITFTEIKDIPKPDPDALAFECKDKDGTHLGVLYMDFFTRPGKGGGAWCGGYRSQTYKDGKRVAPVVTTVFNFSKPAEGQPALLTADETETVFHEFGHALHGLFCDVHYYGVSDVPRDFVELPSQVDEHWAVEPEVSKVYAKHYQTGEVIPQALVDKMIKSGKYGQGFATTEYLAASYLDMDYHVLKEIPADLDIEKFEAKVLGDRGLIRQIPSRYRSTYFGHTMEGGYTAGYYSYIWAEVLDCDAFEAFKETGDIFNSEVAAKFRTYVLSLHLLR